MWYFQARSREEGQMAENRREGGGSRLTLPQEAVPRLLPSLILCGSQTVESKCPLKGWPWGLSLLPQKELPDVLPHFPGPAQWLPCAFAQAPHFTLKKVFCDSRGNLKKLSNCWAFSLLLIRSIFSDSKNHMVRTSFQKVICSPLPLQLRFSQN
jgi:hypothetical protein